MNSLDHRGAATSESQAEAALGWEEMSCGHGSDIEDEETTHNNARPVFY